MLQRDEVLELVEGPREEVLEPEMLLRISASKDGVIGWMTLRDKNGVAANLSTTFYVCKSTIAMTDEFDIKSCNVIRKVDIGETLELIGKQTEQTDADITRLRLKAVRDGKEGWVTLQGNQGTIFVELSKSHYVVAKKVSIREGSSKDAHSIREMQVGEAVEALDSPKEEKPEGQTVLCARALDDGKTGWVVFSGGAPPMRPWHPKYVCKAVVPITPNLAAKDADAVRNAEVGETFEAIEGPMWDQTTKSRRIRCATADDGVVGWATLRGNDSEVFLQVA